MISCHVHLPSFACVTFPAYMCVPLAEVLVQSNKLQNVFQAGAEAGDPPLDTLHVCIMRRASSVAHHEYVTMV